jgi:hypothetical protein
VVESDIQKYVSVVQPNADMVGMVFPGTFLLDRRGRVRSRFFEEFYREPNTSANLFLAESRQRPSTGRRHEDFEQTSGSHHISNWLGHNTGKTASALVVELKPGPGIHVYAPGASGYRVVTASHHPAADRARPSYQVSGV